ncbi:L,D-transpeptidase family protein [Limoniibacter endophyticus]|uniref:L,D-transpeptidase n=1 Tax=Limoniibacter endophyticus TaxID=1565040 RepID=A0A8J3DR69_9HYPH|nr:L,D-transpeptidase family protein [Limoniibacter endophyticus]GHC75878.1 L,D-transpeptidase [Limoniibacter endophyticus]
MSRSLRFKALILLTATAILTPHNAQAEYLFDRLFGRNKQQTQQVAPAPAQRGRAPATQSTMPIKRQVAPKPIRKIAAPSYYTYRVATPGSLDIAALAEKLDAYQGPELAPAKHGFRWAIFAASAEKISSEKPIAEAVVAHYAAKPEFVWIENGTFGEKAKIALDILEHADREGLSPADYTVPALGTDAASLAVGELTLSARLLRFAQDVNSGRVDPNKLSGYHDFARKDLDLSAAMNALTSGDLAAYLESLQPKDKVYVQLRRELEMLRAMPDDRIEVSANLLIRPGAADAEFSKILAVIAEELRAQRDNSLITAATQSVDGAPVTVTEADKMLALLEQHKDSEIYSAELVPIIKAAQERAGLKPDGIIGPRTVQRLVGLSKSDRIARVEVAMEQLRWHPQELGETRVFINQPAFIVNYIENGELKLTMKTVIGTKANQTSFFYDQIDNVVFNPYWGVPTSIIVNEMLPRLRSDPGYLDRAGYEVVDSKGRKIPSSSINWAAHGSRIPYSVRQVPSERNALGELKILFPNKHAIYMHDTPARALFAREDRAYSHGCVRLENPRAMAAALLDISVEEVGARIKGGKTSGAKVKRDIPVYIAYFTAWPDASGKVHYYNDIYERDEYVLKALDKVSASRSKVEES